MKILLNGEETCITDKTTAAELLASLTPENSRVAILVNDLLIKAADRKTTILNEGDRVELITMAGGG